MNDLTTVEQPDFSKLQPGDVIRISCFQIARMSPMQWGSLLSAVRTAAQKAGANVEWREDWRDHSVTIAVF